MESIDRTALDLAVAQGGVVTTEQLIELGFSKRQITRRVMGGRWTVVMRGVYKLAEPRDRRDVLHAVGAVWAGSVVSHESAAELHAIPYIDFGRRLIVSHHTRTTHRFPDVEVRRTHDLDAWHIVEIGGLRVTTVARTVVDLVATRSERHVGAIIDRLVSDERVDLMEIVAVLGSTGRRGKPGTQKLRAVLAERVGDDRSASTLERRGRVLLAGSGLPEPIHEYPIPWSTGRRFDDAYPDRRIAIEWDSRRFHGQLASFEADRLRDRDAAINGWTVLRFTWDDVHNHPGRVVGALRAVLAA